MLRGGRPGGGPVALEVSWVGLRRAGVGEAVGLGSGFDDVSAEGEPVDDRGTQPRVGEGLRPANWKWLTFVWLRSAC